MVPAVPTRVKLAMLRMTKGENGKATWSILLSSAPILPQMVRRTREKSIENRVTRYMQRHMCQKCNRRAYPMFPTCSLPAPGSLWSCA